MWLESQLSVWDMIKGSIAILFFAAVLLSPKLYKKYNEAKKPAVTQSELGSKQNV